jgi:hypothetical protein
VDKLKFAAANLAALGTCVRKFAAANSPGGPPPPEPKSFKTKAGNPGLRRIWGSQILLSAVSPQSFRSFFDEEVCQ